MKRTTALIHNFYRKPMTGDDIEQQSFAIIDRELLPNIFGAAEWNVVRRLIHTTGDTALMGDIEFSSDAIEAGITALRRGCPIYADSNMIRSGISETRLQSVNPGYDRTSILCHVADADVAAKAKKTGLPRSLLAVQKARKKLNGSIILFGNAPVGLLEVNRMIIEDGLRPALVVGMPVGFVHVEECKRELRKLGIPHIVINGRRGGSPLAVSVIHSLCSLATNRPATATDSTTRQQPAASHAVIIMGHGSKRPAAARAMNRVARRLKAKWRYPTVEVCHMENAQPDFRTTLEKCIRRGANHVTLIPYFLHNGVHINKDIPLLVARETIKHCGIRVTIGACLGYDEYMVDLVHKRITEAHARKS